MSIVQEQTQSAVANAVVAQLTATFDSTPTQGNLLIVTAQRRNTGGFTMNSAGWTNVFDVLNTSFGNHGHWYKIAGASEATAVIIDLDSTTSNCAIVIVEYSGMEAAPLDVFDTNSTAASVVTLSCGTTAVTAQADELIIATMGVRGVDASGFSWTNSFIHQTDIYTSGTDELSLAWAERIVTGTLAAETTASWTGANQAGGGIVTYKAVAAASDIHVPSANPQRNRRMSGRFM